MFARLARWTGLGLVAAAGLWAQVPLTLTCVPATGPTQLGVPYSTTCTASGGVTPYNFSTDLQPLWLSITGLTPNTITISGTPSTLGAYTFSVGVTDSGTLPSSRTVTFTGTIGTGVATTVTTNPSGLGIVVDGTTYTSPHTFSWTANSIHTIGTPSPQGTGNTRYLYASWSDGGAQTHDIRTLDTPTTYTASFKTQYRLTTAVSPAGAGSVSAVPSSPDGFYDSGTGLRLTAAPLGTWTFTGWSGDLTGTTNPQSLTMSAPRSVTANFTLSTVPITVTTSPPSLQIVVDAVTYTAPQTFNWTNGSSHTIGAPSPQSSLGTRYLYASWSDGGAQTHSVTVGSVGATYTANYRTQYYLTRTILPAGTGTITANPSTADGFYDSGTSVQLTAVPSGSNLFSSWSGDLTGSANPQSVVMSAARSVTANFTPTPVTTITTNPAGRQIIVDGATLTAPQSFTWTPGSSHTVSTPSPQAGGTIRYLFVSWSDGGAQAHTITAPGASTTYTANFRTQYLLTTTISPLSSGTVTAAPTSGDGFYDSGTSVQLTARATGSYVFSSWSGDLTGATNPQSVGMTAPRSVTANFTLPTASITVTTNPAGLQIVVDGTAYTAPRSFTWTAGSSHTIGTTSPQGAGNTRQVFANWSDGGALTHTVTAPSASTTYTANFTTQHRLTTAVAPAGSGTVAANPSSPDGFYTAGTSVQLTAAATGSYVFSSWSGDLTGATNPQSVTMSAPRSATANFTLTASITVTTNPSGLQIVVDGTTYTAPRSFTWTAGSNHAISATSPQGTGDTRQVFANWSDGGAQAHTITAPGASTTYTASFTTQHRLTTTVAPAGMGTVSANPTSPDGFYNSGTSVQLTAAAITGNVFSSWTGDLTGTANPQSVVMSAPRAVTANFGTAPVTTITTSPTGLQIVVDGTTLTAPQTFVWAAGSSHSISSTSPQGTGNTRQVFANWSDGGAQAHTITAPGASTTYTASFTTQHRLTTTVAPAGLGTISCKSHIARRLLQRRHECAVNRDGNYGKRVLELDRRPDGHDEPTIGVDERTARRDGELRHSAGDHDHHQPHGFADCGGRDDADRSTDLRLDRGQQSFDNLHLAAGNRRHATDVCKLERRRGAGAHDYRTQRFDYLHGQFHDAAPLDDHRSAGRYGDCFRESHLARWLLQ